MSDRYKNKPLVMLLEKYILWSISELSGADEARLREMAPHLGGASLPGNLAGGGRIGDGVPARHAWRRSTPCG